MEKDSLFFYYKFFFCQILKYEKYTFLRKNSCIILIVLYSQDFPYLLNCANNALLLNGKFFLKNFHFYI